MSNNESSFLNNYKLVDGFITNKDTGMIVPDLRIENLPLGNRALHCFKKAGKNYISDLLNLSVQEMLDLPNMGMKSVSEIIACVPKYMKEHEIGKPCVKGDSSEATYSSTLAPDYEVVNGLIYHRKTGIPYQDVHISELQLGVRAYNCLMRNGNTTIASLIGMPYSDLPKIRNLGMKSVTEIEEKLEEYLDKYLEPARDGKDHPPTKKTVIQSDVMKCYQGREFAGFSMEDFSEMLPSADAEELQGVLSSLIDAGILKKADESYLLVYRSFHSVLWGEVKAPEINDRTRNVLRKRSIGTTLEEIGKIEGATRERIRQIEKKGLDRLTSYGSAYFEEDKYAYLFRNYCVEKELFDYFNEPKSTWYYLNLRYMRGGAKLEKALEDAAIDVKTRRLIHKYIYRNHLLIDGSYIPISRPDIEDFVIKKYCREEVTMDEYIRIYNQFIAEHNLDSELAITDRERRYRTNRLPDSMNLLWKQNQRLRYYDIEGKDYTELLDVLNLSQYKDIELSTKKFLVDYPEIMERYDLRDEYEIHNLLKKIVTKEENPTIKFNRMPMIQFGSFDRAAAVRNALFAHAPITQDALVQVLENEYGMQAETIKANWLSGIAQYYHRGQYSIDFQDLPEADFEKLKNYLTNDFYLLSELRSIFAQIMPDADIELLSSYNLKKMGFLVYNTYVIQHFPSADAFFEHFLLNEETVDIAPVRKQFTGITLFAGKLANLRHEMTLIEYEPYKYMNISLLEREGYDRERLKQYGDRVWNFLKNDDYFTIQSLRNEGYKDEMDKLGFGELFYSSILKEDKRFSWTRVGGQVVFSPKAKPFTVQDFLVERVAKVKSIEAETLVAHLLDYYGISFDKSTLLFKIKGGEVYIDSISGKLYDNYSTYSEET